MGFSAKGGGGGGNPLLEGIKDVGGAALNLLSAPQQVLFKQIQGANLIRQGQFKEGGKRGLGALGEILSLGQAGGDIDFANALGRWDKKNKTIKAAKLPKGLNMGANILLDPTLFVGVGAGASAAKGVKTLAKSLDISENAVKAGLRAGKINLAKGGATRSKLVEDLIAGGTKAKQANKIAKLTARRGAGGVTAFVPFTEKSLNLVSDAKLARTGGKLAAAGSKVPGAEKTVDALRKTFKPGHELDEGLGDAELSARIRQTLGERQSAADSKKDDLLHELKNAAHKSGVKQLTDEDDADILFMIEAPDEAASILQAKPYLAPLHDVIKRGAQGLTREQVQAGFLGNSNEGALAAQAAKAAESAAKKAEKLAESEAAAKAAKENANKLQAEFEKAVASKGGATAKQRQAAAAARRAAKKAEAELQKRRDALAADLKSGIYEDITTFKTPEEAEAALQRQADLVMSSGDDTTELDELTERLQNANQGRGIEAPQSVEWDARLEAGIARKYGSQAEPGTVKLVEKNIIPAQPGYGDMRAPTGPDMQFTVVAWGDDGAPIGWVDGSLEHGMTTVVRPDQAGQGVASRMYETLRQQGIPVEELSGKSGYTPAGAAFAAGRRAKAAAAAVDVGDKKTDALLRQVQRLEQNAEKAASEVETAAAKVDELKKAGRAAKSEREKAVKDLTRKQAAKSKADTKLKKIAAELAEAQKSNKGVRENYMQRIMTPEARNAAAGLKGSARDTFATEVAGNVRTALVQRAERARSFFPEMPARILNQLKEVVDGGGDLAAALADPQAAKFIKNVAPDELPDMIKAFEDLAKQLPEGPMYTESAVLSILNRSTSANRALQAKAAVDELTEMTDSAGGRILYTADDLAQRAEAGQALPSGWVEFDLPHLGRHAAPKALADEIQKVAGITVREGWTEDLKKGLEQWGKFWRTQATVGLLGAIPFGMRNGRSNFYLIMTDEFGPTEIMGAMKAAKKLEDKVRKIVGSKRVGGKFKGTHADEVVEGGLDATLRANLSEAEYDMWRAMQKHGITTKGFFDVDFTGGIQGERAAVLGQPTPAKGGRAGRLVKNVLGTQGKVAREGRNLNQAIETNARMAAFLLNYGRYGNYAEAAQHTKKVLFDYSELTDAEQRILKNVIPFYTFMRKNLPRQLDTLVTNPGRLAVPEKISQGITEPLPEDAADYQRDSGSRVVPIAFPLIGGGIVTPDRPFHQISETLAPLRLAGQGRGREAAGAAANVASGPQISLLNSLLEIATGKDSFTRGNVPEGFREGATRLVTSQLPSVGRLPQVDGVSSLKNRDPRPLPNELLKLLTGIRVAAPKE